MVWAIAGVAVVVIGLVTLLVVSGQRRRARVPGHADPAQVWLHGDPAPQSPARDNPHGDHGEGDGDADGDND